MEEKSTEWILMLLAHRMEQIPILDTIIIRDGKSLKHIYSDLREIIQEKSAKPIPSIIQSLLNIYTSNSSVMCCFIRGKTRKFFTKLHLKSIISKKIPKIDQIQLCHAINGLQISPTYLFDLYFTHEKYRSKLYSKENQKVHQIKNKFVHSYAKEIAYLILRAIDLQENKRVLKLQLEFVKDSNNKLFLHQINECKVLPIPRLKYSIFNNLSDLNYFISQFKGKKSKKFYENTNCPVNSDKVLNYSRISIDSVDSDNPETEENRENGSNLSGRNSFASSRSSFDRNTLRSASIKQENRSFSGRSLRKSGVIMGTFKEKLKPDEEIHDSWDYGDGNANFLEMIGRQVLKNNSRFRPISPEHDELKQQIRNIYEKISLTPSIPKTFDYACKSFPSIRVSPDPFSLVSNESASTRISINSALVGKLKPLNDKRYSFKELPNRLRVSVLSPKFSYKIA